MKWVEVFDYDGLNLIRKPTGEKTTDTRFSGKVAGTKVLRGRTAYILVMALGSIHYAHRIIYEMHYGEIPEGKGIDHIDGDGTNNRLSNLRLATQSENAKNQRIRLDNTSGVTGVRWARKEGKWAAQIKVGGKQKHLGFFRDFTEAVRTRKSAEQLTGFHATHGREDAATTKPRRNHNLRFKCPRCGKLTSGRIPRDSSNRSGDLSFRYPRRHKAGNGEVCPGTFEEAEWVEDSTNE